MTSERLRPLLRRAALLPGESVASLIARLERLNYYEPDPFIRRLCARPWNAIAGFARNGYPVNAAQFERLAHLTGLSVASLWAASPAGRGFRGTLRPAAWAAFCPACLRESAYHRLAWSLADVRYCVRHAAVLAEACPACQHPASVQAITAGRCGACQADLRRAAVTPVVRDPYGLAYEWVLQAALGFDAPRPAPRVFPDAPAWQLLRYVRGAKALASWDGVCDLVDFDLQRRHSPWRFYHQLDLEHTAEAKALSAAVHSLAGWPWGFFRLLDFALEVLRQFDRTAWRASAATLATDLYRMKWNGVPFVWGAIRGYLACDPLPAGAGPARLPSAPETPTYLTLDEATRALRVPAGMLHGLVMQRGGQGCWPVHHGRNQKTLVVVPWARFLALRRRFLRPQTAAEAAELLALEPAAIPLLVRLRALRPLPGSSREGRQFSVQAVARLFNRLMRRAHPSVGLPQSIVTLCGLSCSEGDQAAEARTLVQAFLQGRLQGYWLNRAPTARERSSSNGATAGPCGLPRRQPTRATPARSELSPRAFSCVLVAVWLPYAPRWWRWPRKTGPARRPRATAQKMP